MSPPADAWELEPTTPEWLPSILARLLSAGIPPTAIARAFEMNVEPIRDMLMSMRVDKYGSAEIAELVTIEMFNAFSDIRRLREQAPPLRRLQLDMALISKASAFAKAQTPDMLAKIQGELDGMFGDVRATDEEVVGSIYETVAADAPIDDPEKRPER